jgi:hypothetical protein
LGLGGLAAAEFRFTSLLVRFGMSKGEQEEEEEESDGEREREREVLLTITK